MRKINNAVNHSVIPLTNVVFLDAGVSGDLVRILLT